MCAEVKVSQSVPFFFLVLPACHLQSPVCQMGRLAHKDCREVWKQLIFYSSAFGNRYLYNDVSFSFCKLRLHLKILEPEVFQILNYCARIQNNCFAVYTFLNTRLRSNICSFVSHKLTHML